MINFVRQVPRLPRQMCWKKVTRIKHSGMPNNLNNIFVRSYIQMLQFTTISNFIRQNYVQKLTDCYG